MVDTGDHLIVGCSAIRPSPTPHPTTSVSHPSPFRYQITPGTEGGAGSNGPPGTSRDLLVSDELVWNIEHIPIPPLLAEVTRYSIESAPMPLEMLSAYDALETRPSGGHGSEQYPCEANMALVMPSNDATKSHRQIAMSNRYGELRAVTSDPVLL